VEPTGATLVSTKNHHRGPAGAQLVSTKNFLLVGRDDRGYPRGVSAGALYDRIERVANLLGSRARATARAHGVEPIQLDVLHFLARCNRYSDTSKAVAEFFGLTKGTVSQTLAALHRKGLVDKQADPADGRRIHLILTRTGERVVREAFPPELLSTVAMPEDAALVAGLDGLLRRMQGAAGSASFGECHSCTHFRREGERRYRCGLTGEVLRRVDIEKICLEHTTPSDEPHAPTGSF
jgi:DNA-binding MarR family transcriptional regulator